jgi:L-fuculose-phosphate aldolase
MLTAVGDILREAYRRNFISVRDGNISLHRKSSKLLYITPAGFRKTIIHPELIIKRKWAMDEQGNKDRTLSMDAKDKPSGELEMHELLQRTATETRAVVHIHCTHVVAAILKGFELSQLVNRFPELGRYTKVAPNVQELAPISSELAKETYASMTNQLDRYLAGAQLDWHRKPMYDIVGQGGHGVTAIGSDPWTAYEACERLDHVCQIVLASGISPKDL